MFSWYDIALRLRLPELIEQNRKDDTVLANLVSALVKESSVRNRRTAEVTISGLAMMPKTPSVLPPIETVVRPDSPLASPRRPPPLRSAITTAATNNNNNNNNNNNTANTNNKPMILRRLTDNYDRFSQTKPKPSVENWIPEDARMRTIQRNIMFAKETLENTMKLENSLAREMKRLLVSDLQRAKMEESLDVTKKIPCGCCTQDFLYVNLPMKVSRKAIVDIRIKWSGKLSSSTVFLGLSYRDLMNEGNGESGKGTGGGGNGSGTAASYDTVPLCYDEVGVCVFCAQFFQEPEVYRPSFAMITHQERKAAFMEAKRKEQEYWDPLKMVEEDRKRLEDAGIEESEVSPFPTERGMDI
eukprot:scaffold647_cov253-Ochromonas_danica.AAC.15